jgi:hypothetical protein
MRPSLYTLPSLLLFTACTVKGINLTAALTDSGSDGSTTDTPGTTTDATTDAISDATSDATSDSTTGTTGEPTSTSPITGDSSGSTTSDDTTDSTTSTTGEPSGRPLDILFVIDNSGSMADEQSRLAAGADALLAAAGDRDLRIGFTTTDMGNPRCVAAMNTPENGAMSTASCRERVADGEFMFNLQDFSASCLQNCQHESWTITPTAVDDTQQLAARPWFERTAGVANVDVPLAEAIACSLPQGVAGCGFESHLEALRAAVTRAQTPGDPQLAFIRPDADLTLVFLTDEMDCSFTPEFDEIFTTNKVFWNDPFDPAPTSSMCLRAGVDCQGDPSMYSGCPAVNRDTTGAITPDPNQAVLRPVADYTALLNELQAQKSGGALVRMIAIAGVPVGFEDGSAELVLADSPDPEFQQNFGIGPGCVDGDQTAVPPLRLLDVGQSFGAATFFSICESTFDKALAAAAAG